VFSPFQVVTFTKQPQLRGFFLHPVAAVVHPMVMPTHAHLHRSAGSGGRVGLSYAGTARLRASACRTAGALCNCARTGEGERRSQDNCFDFHGRFLLLDSER
jgi:hypothetical protein